MTKCNRRNANIVLINCDSYKRKQLDKSVGNIDCLSKIEIRLNWAPLGVFESEFQL